MLVGVGVSVGVLVAVLVGVLVGVAVSVVPAACLACGFVFRTRQRLTRPGRCPVCDSSHIEPPRFSVAGSAP